MTSKRTFVGDSAQKYTERVQPVKKRFSVCSGRRGKRRKIDSGHKTVAPFQNEHGDFYEDPSDSSPSRYYPNSHIDGKRTYQPRNVWDCNLESQALQLELLTSAKLMNKRSDDVADSRKDAFVHMEDDDENSVEEVLWKDEKKMQTNADDEWSEENGSPDQF